MMDFHRALAVLFALAPALLCVVAALVSNAHVLSATLDRALDRVRHDEDVMHVLAEVLVHLSTYGTVLFGFVLQVAVGAHMDLAAKALASLTWFVVMLRAAIAVRRALRRLHGGGRA